MLKTIQLNPDQKCALDAVFGLLTSEQTHAMVLSGVAGSGKTTLLAEVVKLAAEMGMTCRSLSPTGKAASTLESKLNQLLPSTFTPIKVYTIHQYLYSLLTPGHYILKSVTEGFDLLIVDEASMVSDFTTLNPFLQFGSGKLLTDLLTLVKNVYQHGYTRRPVKVLFVGDSFQLPPVRSSFSPAMNPLYLTQQHQLSVLTYHLTQVVRQAEGSGVLAWANQIRQGIEQPRKRAHRVPINGVDIRKTTALNAMQRLASEDAINDACVAIVATNLMAWEYNIGVRHLRWGDGYSELQVGEKLLVTRNAPALSLSNGELVTVVDVSGPRTTQSVTLANGNDMALSFRQVILAVSNGTTLYRVHAVVLENYLYAPLSERQSHQLAEALRLLVADPSHQSLYDQLLHVKFGYALTCHKAQGSEWPQVIIDPTGMDTRTIEGKQWLYTAVTRSSDLLEVVG